MFTNISWMNYLTVVALLITLYYLLVGLRYYPTELKEILSGKRKLQFKATRIKRPDRADQFIPDAQIPGGEHSFINTSDATFDEVEALITALVNTIGEASQKQYIKQEFSYSLKRVLKDYPQIQDSPFRSAIDELILSECEKYGTITLSEDDIVRLWDDVV